MKLNKPKVITWLIAVILGVLAIIALLIPTFSSYAVWLALAGLALLALGNAVKGL